MKVYNQEKNQILEEYDLTKGYLKNDTITNHYEEVKGVEEQWHYETIREYANGGKDVRKVIDVAGVPYSSAKDEIENIYVYVPYTEEEILENKKNELRYRREQECFPIINRGKLWYDNLTEEQLSELDKWYREWLNVTDTLIVPEKPNWVK
jgi:hypothetical protein